jgi:biopolymer transport protein TolR
MGASANFGAKGAARRGRRYRPMSEINVTPFVDVMLVLLIVFMISAPLLATGVPIELPEAKAKPLDGDTKPLTVSVDQKGRVFLQSTEIKVEEVAPKLKAIARNGYDERIYVRADRSVDYGAVMKVMGVISAAGFRRIGLVTEPDGRG